MHSIEVDFQVLKTLMARRADETVSYNDVIRGLLNLPKAPLAAAASNDGAWSYRGDSIAAGTELRRKHKGAIHMARVERGGILLADDGKLYDSPSAAGVAVTGYAVNGWRFWECRTPGSEKWRPLAALRK